MTGTITTTIRVADLGGGGGKRNLTASLLGATDGSAARVAFKDRLAGEYDEGAALSDTGSGDPANSALNPRMSEITYTEPQDDKAVALTPPIHPILAPISEVNAPADPVVVGEAPSSRGGGAIETTAALGLARGEKRSEPAVAPGEPATRQAQASQLSQSTPDKPKPDQAQPPQVTAAKTESQPIDAPILAKMTRFDAELGRSPGAPRAPRAPVATDVAAATVPASSGAQTTDTTSPDPALPQPRKDPKPQAAVPDKLPTERRASEAAISSPLGKITPRAPSPGNEPGLAAAQPASSEAPSSLRADTVRQPQTAPDSPYPETFDRVRAEQKPTAQPVPSEPVTRKAETLGLTPAPVVTRPVRSSSETISARQAEPVESLTATGSYDGGPPATAAPDGAGLLSATLSGNLGADAANLVDGQIGQLGSPDKFSALAQTGEAGAARNAVLDFSAGLAWIDKLASEITAMASDTGTLSFDLAPEKLGKMNVSLEKGESGMEIAIHVSNKEAANLLATSQTQLKQELTNAGLQLGAFDIGGQAMAGHDGDGGTAARAGADDMAEGRQGEPEVEQAGSDTQNVGRLGDGNARFA